MPRKSKAHELVWADEVMEVYQNLGTLPESRHWTTASARHLFDWVCLEENKSKFLSMMVPKATDVLSKYGDKDVTEEVIKIDKKTLKDLKEALAVAVLAAAEGKEPKAEPESDPEPMLTIDDLI